MKRIISAFLVIMVLALCFTGCGKKAEKRVLYNSDLSKYVELGKYKGIKIDTSSDDFKKAYDDVVASDVEANGFYVMKTTGTVAKGDVANIDYVGKKGGVAFEGGTAQGYDLEIGSGQFIPGFEDGLIDVKIGDTVDLNLTFPSDYGNAELAGAAVVFTVKVNYVKTEDAEKPEDYYKELDFKSVKEYEADVRKRAAETILLDSICESSKIKEYPKEDTETIYNAFKNTIEQNLQSQYGIDLASYLSSQGQTEEQFKETMVNEQIGTIMDTQMIVYAILDKEGLKLEQKDIDAKVDETLQKIGNSSVTKEQVLEYYGDYYFEEAVVNDVVMDYLYKNAKIS